MDMIGLEKIADRHALFRLAPEYRRCGAYLLVGTLFLAGTAILLQQLGLGWAPVYAVAILAVPMLGCALLAFRQVLRIDDRGMY
jgi:hypothetical protein